MISSGLLIKGLGALAAISGTGGVFYCYVNKKWIWAQQMLEDILMKRGLVCETYPGGSDFDCTLKEGGELIFKENSKEYKVTSTGDANLRLYRFENREYELVKGKKNFDFYVFTVEGGDMTLDNEVKVKEYEIYSLGFDIEIPSGYIKDFKPTKVHNSNVLIKELTGFPCDLPKGSEASTSDCTLNSKNIDQIKFEGKTDKAKATLIGDNSSISVNISKLATSDPDFPLDYKFTFTSTQETTINLGGKNISLGAGVSKDLRIKKTPVPNTKKQALTLEEAWTVKSLGAKVGLECPETVNNGAGECTLKNGNVVNINNGDSNKKFKGLSKKNTTGNKIVKFEEKKAGHNQGFKFYTEETNGIALQSSEGDSDSEDKKIAHKGDDANPVSYQILKDGDEWYLTKVTKGGAAA